MNFTAIYRLRQWREMVTRDLKCSIHSVCWYLYRSRKHNSNKPSQESKSHVFMQTNERQWASNKMATVLSRLILQTSDMWRTAVEEDKGMLMESEAGRAE